MHVASGKSEASDDSRVSASVVGFKNWTARRISRLANRTTPNEMRYLKKARLKSRIRLQYSRFSPIQKPPREGWFLLS